jgi:alpha-tubulin suppressor-like RCC1 family protein
MKFKYQPLLIVVLILTNLSVNYGQVSTNGLVGYWPLDGNTLDVSGNGNHGTNMGATSTASGQSGQAYMFDGNDSIDVGNLDFSSGAFTVSAWIRTTRSAIIDDYRIIISKLNSTGGPFELLLGDGRVGGGLNSGIGLTWTGGTGSVNLQSTGGENLRDGNWHMVTMTYQNGQQELYIDGALKQTSFFGGPLPTNSAHILIGGTDTFSPYHHKWIGDIDEVLIYNRALSYAEVQQLSNIIPNSPPAVTLTGPSPGATYSELANLTLSADAFDSDGVIQKVEFFNGATKLGEDLSAPYSFEWLNVIGGTYNLTAKATDNAGAKTTSGVVGITITSVLPAPPTNLQAALTSNWQANLTWTDNSNNESAFKIERKIGTGDYILIASLGANTSAYSDNNLVGDTTYTYRVYATGSAGNTSYSNESIVTTLHNPLPTIPTNGLIGHWSLDGNAQDTSGNGNHGTISGATVTAGRFGQAYQFNGTAGISVGDLNFSSGQFTVSAWVRTTFMTGYDDYRMFLSKINTSTGTGPFELFLLDGHHPTQLNGAALAVWQNGTGVATPYTSQPNCRDGNWHMITASYESGLQKFYVDGVLYDTQNYSGPLPVTTSSVVIGGVNGFGPYHHAWVGDIDEVVIYNRSFADVEVQQLFGTGNFPTGLQATAVSSSQVNLSWDASTNVEIVGYKLFRNGVQIATLAGNATAFSDTPLATFTTYNYSISSFDAANNDSLQSPTVQVTTLPFGGGTFPTGLAATAVSSSQVNLSWDASTNVEIVGYKLYRNGVQIATLAGNATSFSDTPLAALTTYNYSISSFDAANNNSVQSPTVQVTTLPYVDTIAPTVNVTSPFSGATISGTFTLSADASDNIGVVGVRFKVDGNDLGEDTSYPYWISLNTLSVSNGSHVITAVARDAAGNSTTSTGVTVTVTNIIPPAAPSNLMGTALSSTKVQLSWNDNSNDETDFVLERKTGISGTYKSIATLSANTTTYLNNGLSANQTYVYRIKARRSLASSSYSPEAIVTTWRLPTAPSNLVATTASETQINLSWIDNSNDETSFQIERKTGAAGSYSIVATLGANITSLSHNGLIPGTQYFFRIRSVRLGDKSGYSNEAHATTLNIPLAPISLSAQKVSTTQLNLQWTDNSANETSFKIERKEGVSGSYAQIGTVGANVTTYSDTTVSEGITYVYRVCASNANGNSSYSNEATYVSSPILGAVAAGESHTVTLKDDGTVWAWGRNNYGQVGNGSLTNILYPTQLTTLTNSIVEVAAGTSHTVALDPVGQVWAWGRNQAGQLGDGTTSTRSKPILVSSLGNAVHTIEAGEEFTVAVKENGSVWAWGRNTYGQIGDGTLTTRTRPASVSGFTASVTDIASGFAHSVALQSDGTVWTWGLNNYGQLGNGTVENILRPSQTSLAGVTQVAAGNYFSMALRSDGTVWTWGSNGSGQLGDGTTVNKSYPTQILGLDRVIDIACGGSFAMALKSDGSIWAWGYNSSGQVGDGTTTTRSRPVRVNGANLILGINGGASHSIGLKLDGTVWTWGLNTYGQLGDGTVVKRYSPGQVLGLDLISTP